MPDRFVTTYKDFGACVHDTATDAHLYNFHALAHQLNRLNDELHDKLGTIAELSTEIDALRDEGYATDQSLEIDTLRSQIDTYQTTLTNLQLELGHANAKLRQAEHDLANTNAALLTEREGRLENALAAKRVRLLEQRLDRLEGDYRLVSVALAQHVTKES